MGALPASYDTLVRLWGFRILLEAGGLKKLMEDRNDVLLDFLGLKRFRRGSPFDAATFVATVHELAHKAQAKAIPIPCTSPLSRNIRWLGDLLRLSETERAILHFCIVHDNHSELPDLVSLTGNLSFAGVHVLFSRILGIPERRIRSALAFDSILSRAGLLGFNLRNRWTFENKIELLPGLADLFCLPQKDPLQVFSPYFVKGSEAELSLSDFSHMGEDVAILRNYLAEALSNRRVGVNVLLYGTPGTGKTQFTRALAKALGADLFEVATQSPGGSSIQGDNRFRAFRLSQAALKSGNGNLILFDEVEDVFRLSEEDHFSVQRGNRSGLKGCLNRTLEENPIPTLWVTNNRWMMDPAFIRRFDYTLEMKIPPRSVRSRILDTCIGSLPIGSEVKSRLARHENLSPALISRAVKVTSQIRGLDRCNTDLGNVFQRILGNSLEALGHPREARDTFIPITDYRPEALNTDQDLGVIRAGLQTHGTGRLCLYGPPGTGKTAFGRHLAEVLDRPLLVKRASDLQSMWVGETEKNMARMFEEARMERAVLLLDEADSFLHDRQSAQRSWEVSQVNEMLTQMEAFEGVFIASTNLMENLDAASIRRFDLKIRFGYLKADQAWILFRDAALRLGFEGTPSAREALGSLRHLTPGDFATVIRQSRLSPVLDAETLVDRLRMECKAKPEGRQKTVGF